MYLERSQICPGVHPFLGKKPECVDAKVELFMSNDSSRKVLWQDQAECRRSAFRLGENGTAMHLRNCLDNGQT